MLLQVRPQKSKHHWKFKTSLFLAKSQKHWNLGDDQPSEGEDAILDPDPPTPSPCKESLSHQWQKGYYRWDLTLENLLSENFQSSSVIGEGGEINSADREAFASFGEEKWRAKFLLKRQIDLEEVDTLLRKFDFHLSEFSGAGKVPDTAVPRGWRVQGGRAEHRAQRGDLPRGAQQDGRLRQAHVPRLRHRLDRNGHLSGLLQVNVRRTHKILVKKSQQQHSQNSSWLMIWSAGMQTPGGTSIGLQNLVVRSTRLSTPSRRASPIGRPKSSTTRRTAMDR